MNETTINVIGKETPLERPCKMPPRVMRLARFIQTFEHAEQDGNVLVSLLKKPINNAD